MHIDNSIVSGNLIRLLEDYHAAVGSHHTFYVLEEKLPLIVLTPQVVAGYTRYAEVPEMKMGNFSRVGALAHIWMPRVNRNLCFRTGVLYSRLDLYGATRTFLTASYEIEFEKEFVIIPVAFLSQSVSVGIAVRLNGR